MICHQYEQLTIVERYELYGKMQHLIQNNAGCYRLVSKMVKEAEAKGLLEGVKFMPPWEGGIADRDFPMIPVIQTSSLKMFRQK